MNTLFHSLIGKVLCSISAFDCRMCTMCDASECVSRDIYTVVLMSLFICVLVRVFGANTSLKFSAAI